MKDMTVITPSWAKHRMPPKWQTVLKCTTLLDRRPEAIDWLKAELDISAYEASRLVQLAGRAARELLSERG